jgi:hypothetical protein
MLELLLAAMLTGFVVIGIVAFLRQGLAMYYYDRARVMINRDIRSFTNQIDVDAVTANGFYIYPDFNTRYDASSVPPELLRADGQAGDFLVLVYLDPAQASTGASMVTRLIGYYREVTNATLNTGPVHRFDTAAPGYPTPLPSGGVNFATTPLYQILSTYVTGSASSYPIVTQLAQGLATNAPPQTTPTPRLFYNFVNQSVMINAQMSESLTERGVMSQSGNTYNFSVSPRG